MERVDAIRCEGRGRISNSGEASADMYPTLSVPEDENASGEPPMRWKFPLGAVGRQQYREQRAAWYLEHTGNELEGTLAAQNEAWDDLMRNYRARSDRTVNHLAFDRFYLEVACKLVEQGASECEWRDQVKVEWRQLSQAQREAYVSTDAELDASRERLLMQCDAAVQRRRCEDQQALLEAIDEAVQTGCRELIDWAEYYDEPLCRAINEWAASHPKPDGSQEWEDAFWAVAIPAASLRRSGGGAPAFAYQRFGALHTLRWLMPDLDFEVRPGALDPDPRVDVQTRAAMGVCVCYYAVCRPSSHYRSKIWP